VGKPKRNFDLIQTERSIIVFKFGGQPEQVFRGVIYLVAQYTE